MVEWPIGTYLLLSNRTVGKMTNNVPSEYWGTSVIVPGDYPAIYSLHHGYVQTAKVVNIHHLRLQGKLSSEIYHALLELE